jgi:hypothetical protein
MSKETSFVCKLDAISAAQRARHSELAARLADAVSERRELADGYALRVVAERIGLAAAADHMEGVVVHLEERSSKKCRTRLTEWWMTQSDANQSPVN